MECRDGKSELKKHLKSFSSYIRDRVEVWVVRDCNRTGFFFFLPLGNVSLASERL